MHNRNNNSPQKSIKTYIFRVLFLLCAITVIIFGFSILLAPNSFIQIWQNYFYLIGVVIIGVSTFGALVIPILLELYKENKFFENNERVLISDSNSTKNRLKTIPVGLPHLLHREETSIIFEQLKRNNAILLTGEAGVGKSNIGVSLFEQLYFSCFLIDVRRLSGIVNEHQLSEYFGIQEHIIEVFARLGKKKPCLVIIDQLDTVSRSELGSFMVDFAIECKELYGISVVVISRHNEIEDQLLRPLLEANFEEIICKELNSELVEQILIDNGLENPPNRLIKFSKNILLLDLICSILKDGNPHIVEQLDTETSVWEKYINLFLNREEGNTHINREQILQCLTDFAITGLQSVDRSFYLNDPPTQLQERFYSQGLFTKVNDIGRKYVFKIEKMQDYLYARNATRRGLNRVQVENEINGFYLRNVFRQMKDLYRSDVSPLYEDFLLEVING